MDARNIGNMALMPVPRIIAKSLQLSWVEQTIPVKCGYSEITKEITMPKITTFEQYDKETDEIVEIGRLELESFTPEDCLEEMINWIYEQNIPEEDKLQIECDLRQQFRLNPNMFDEMEGES
jgi:hypothetical protein